MDSGQPQCCGIQALFYATATLLVIMLAASLLWKPFLHLIAELNMIIANVLKYIHKEILPGLCIFDNLAGFFASNEAIICITLVFFIYLLCLIFEDILIYYRFQMNFPKCS